MVSRAQLLWREPVLVTGAAGFIGRALVDRLTADGARTVALLLPEEKVPSHWSKDIEILRGDVTDAGAMARAVSQVGTVVHLAAVVGDWGPEELFQRVTVDGTANVLLPAAKHGIRSVLASSIVVYGQDLGAGLCKEDRRYGKAVGPYSRAKQAQEQLAVRLAEDTDLELTVVRPANVFGVGSRPWVDMVLPLLKNRDFTLIGGGNFDAGLCHVNNLVDLFALAATHPRAVGRIYNCADGFGVTWKQYFGDLARAVNAPAPRSVPRFVASPIARAYERWWRLLGKEDRPPMTLEALNLAGSHHRISIDRARDELGFEPSFTYEQAIRELTEHLIA